MVFVLAVAVLCCDVVTSAYYCVLRLALSWRLFSLVS